MWVWLRMPCSWEMCKKYLSNFPGFISFNSVFQCSNGCRSVCTAAIAQKVPITTTTPISVSSSFQCSAKSRLGSYFNCLFKRKQCSSDDECVQVSPGTRCCPTACGNECLGILWVAFDCLYSRCGVTAKF